VETILKRFGGSGGHRLLQTRRGTIILAAIAAVAAAVVLLLFLHNFRKENAVGGAATVLVAQRVIPKGTVGSVVATEGLYRPTVLPQSQISAGAITNAGSLGDKVATRDIYPGEQITAADFAVGGDAIRGQLTGNQRAVSIPIDAAHGLLGIVRAGDHVDVLAGFSTTSSNGGGRPVLRTLVKDVLVLSAPGGKSTSNTAQSIVVRATDQQSAAMAFAADNGKIWFVLRPPTGASSSSSSGAIDLESLMSQTKPIAGGGN
jgi:Flp pilus assembly protein CpaB